MDPHSEPNLTPKAHNSNKSLRKTRKQTLLKTITRAKGWVSSVYVFFFGTPKVSFEKVAAAQIPNPKPETQKLDS